jgi:hypothetical protein
LRNNPVNSLNMRAGGYFGYDPAERGVSVELGQSDIRQNPPSAVGPTQHYRGGCIVTARLYSQNEVIAGTAGRIQFGLHIKSLR